MEARPPWALEMGRQSVAEAEYSAERSMMTEVDEVEPTSRMDAMTIHASEEDGTIQSIDELQNYGIGAADIQKLKQAGICTVKGVNMTSKRSLLKVKGMSEAKVDKIKETAAKMQDCGFVSALEYSMRRAIVFKLSTGCEELDRLLGGIPFLTVSTIQVEFNLCLLPRFLVNFAPARPSGA